MTVPNALSSVGTGSARPTRDSGVVGQTASLIRSDNEQPQAFADEVSRYPHAAAILDNSARVIVANDRLAALSDDGLSIVDRRLQCANAIDQPALDGVIYGAFASSASGKRVLALISRPSGKRPLIVKALSLLRFQERAMLPADRQSPHAMIVVMDLNGEVDSRSEQTLRILGLTNAECRIASLIGAGWAPREIADRLGLTEGSVRTRLKGMFSKLGLSRQSEITSIVTRIQMFDSIC